MTGVAQVVIHHAILLHTWPAHHCVVCLATRHTRTCQDTGGDAVEGDPDDNSCRLAAAHRRLLLTGEAKCERCTQSDTGHTGSCAVRTWLSTASSSSFCKRKATRQGSAEFTETQLQLSGIVDGRKGEAPHRPAASPSSDRSQRHPAKRSCSYLMQDGSQEEPRPGHADWACSLP